MPSGIGMKRSVEIADLPRFRRQNPGWREPRTPSDGTIRFAEKNGIEITIVREKAGNTPGLKKSPLSGLLIPVPSGTKGRNKQAALVLTATTNALRILTSDEIPMQTQLSLSPSIRDERHPPAYLGASRGSASTRGGWRDHFRRAMGSSGDTFRSACGRR